MHRRQSLDQQQGIEPNSVAAHEWVAQDIHRVMPLGRLMLATSPAATGSVPLTKTIGMVEVAALAASAGAAPPLVKMTESCFLTSSDAIASSRSSWLSAQRYSIVRFWPST